MRKSIWNPTMINGLVFRCRWWFFVCLNSIHLYFLKRHWIICISNQFSIKPVSNHLFSSFILSMCLRLCICVCLFEITFCDYLISSVWRSIRLSFLYLSLSLSLCLGLNMIDTDRRTSFMNEKRWFEQRHTLLWPMHRLGNWIFFFVLFFFIFHLVRDKKTVMWIAFLLLLLHFQL